jgi:Kef-type K+ transport system membrane component KefB
MLLPVAASTGVADVLTDLFVLLLAAKIGDEIFRRIGQPAIVGEILAGVIVGPSVLGIVYPDTPIEVFAELGVVFLLFWVGLETKISELGEVGRTALTVGVLGVVVPLVGGIGLGVARGDDTGTAIFIGAALVATSAGITSAVLIELGALRTRAARTVLGAAIVDDVLALMILAIAVGIAVEGTVDIGSIAATVALAVGFLVFFALGGTRVTQRWPQIFKAPRFSESPLLPAVILCLGLAALASEIGLAAVIGALIAGLIVAETKDQHPIEDEIAPLYAFFPPFFFTFIGTQVDLDALADPEALGLLAIVTVLAVVTKFAGAYLGARSLGRREATTVAVGMVPRGEVGIIVAGIGEAEGVIDTELFAVIVGMSILTTLIAPPLLRLLLRETDSAPPQAA